MIKAVLFDLDETLHDRGGSLNACLQDQHRRHTALSELALEALISRFKKLDRRGRVEKVKVYRALLNSVDGAGDVDAMTLAEDYDRNYWRFAKAFDGLDALLDALKERGLGTRIVTNGKTGFQMRVIDALGLRSRMDVILVSQAEGLRKPDPEIFLRAVDGVDAVPSQCLFVGDSPVADILGARAAGLRDVWFPNGAEWPADATERPDATVGSLLQILKLL